MRKKTSPVKSAALTSRSGKVPAAELQTALGTTLSPYAAAYYQGTSEDKVERQHVRRKWYKRALITLLVIALLAGGWVGWKFIKASNIFGGNIFGFLHPTSLKGEDTGRVNILLTGYSADDPGHAGAQLTDSIMILSVDVKNNTAFMLSIPRDMWVAIPSHGHQKINAAYEYGQQDKFSQDGYPQGGIGLMEKLIHDDFGVNTNYYALINYAALRDAVNAVGGVTVNIQSPDRRGLYDPNIAIADGGPLKLANGPQNLNGQQALNFARARGDSYYSYGFPQSDFDRTQHQRQLLLALKSKALSAGTLSNPLKVGQLLDSFGNNVQTDFTTNEVARLTEIIKKVDNSNIKSLSLNNIDNKNYLRSYTGYGGQSALIPATGLDNYTAIQTEINSLLVVPEPAAPTNQ